MGIHKLKIDPCWIPALENDDKTAEIRFHDRDYQAGDTIEFEGCHVDFVIMHVIRSIDFPEGLNNGYSILSIKRMV